MPGVGTQLLFLLVLTAVVSARPAGTTDKLIEAARRKARFGDYSFLCNLLCETVEDSESDCSYLDWMPFDICDTICEDSVSTTTTPIPTTPNITTPITPQKPVIPTVSTPVTSGTNPTSAAPSTIASPSTSAPVTIAPSGSPSTETPATTAPETTPQLVDSSPAGKDADLLGSSNEVDIITVNLEGNSSSAQLESQETSDKAVSWQELKNRLIPYLPELIKLWCEWREIFSNPTSTSALERLCPPVSNETAQPSIIFNSIANTS